MWQPSCPGNVSGNRESWQQPVNASCNTHRKIWHTRGERKHSWRQYSWSVNASGNTPRKTWQHSWRQYSWPSRQYFSLGSGSGNTRPWLTRNHAFGSGGRRGRHSLNATYGGGVLAAADTSCTLERGVATLSGGGRVRHRTFRYSGHGCSNRHILHVREGGCYSSSRHALYTVQGGRVRHRTFRYNGHGCGARHILHVREGGCYSSSRHSLYARGGCR